MNNVFTYCIQLLFLCFFLTLLSCEDVIEVETNPEGSRLIVNGLVRVDIDEEFAPIAIKVTETSDFFGTSQITQLDDAVILWGQPDPNFPEFQNFSRSFLREFVPGTGIYEPDTIGIVDDRIRTSALTRNTVFYLILEHKGKRYVGQTTYSPTVPIDTIIQGNQTLFDDNDKEVRVTLTDNAQQDDFYVFDFDFGEFLILDDGFFNGQQFEFSYFYEDLDVGQQAEISILGADRQFFNYMDLVLEQTDNNGGVFQTPAATVRGNIFDVTGLDNITILDNTGRPNDFALGYFAVVQEFKQTIIIE